MDAERHLSRGFNWLGGATIVARIVDALTMLAVLLFLTKQQVGVAALVVSVGQIVEALNGLGTTEALINRAEAPRDALDTLFWCVLGASVLVGGATLLAGPVLAAAYGVPGLALYLIPIALKQPVVAAAIIPLALLNRALRYERIAAINAGSSLLAAATRLGLAAAGAGVWAPVAGYSSSGLWVLAGALAASPFLPRRRFSWSSVQPLLRFGVRVTASNLVEQVFKNVDFLLVGLFYGTGRLALYRVAFDLAMEPAMAVGTLVNRTALPVFARLAASGEPLGPALAWSLGRVLLLTAPLAAALVLAARPLTALLHDRQGHSYEAAGLPLAILAAAALVRIVVQLLYPLLMGAGRPGTAARLSALFFSLLTAGIAAVGLLVPSRHGIVAVALVWLAAMPPVLLWSARTLERVTAIRPLSLAPSLRAPLVALAVQVGVVETILALVPMSDAARLATVAGATLLTYATLMRWTKARGPAPGPR